LCCSFHTSDPSNCVRDL